MRVDRRERCNEVLEYFDSIIIVRELTDSRKGYKVACAKNTISEPVRNELYDMFAITYSGFNNKMVFRSYFDKHELEVFMQIKQSDYKARARFKSILKQYGYTYNCTVYSTNLKYDIEFKDDFKLEELAFICKFFLQYMK